MACAIDCCKCTVENPTCACTPSAEITTAYKDRKNNIFLTKEEAFASSILDCVSHEVNKGLSHTTVSSWEIQKVLNALTKLNLLRID